MESLKEIIKNVIDGIEVTTNLFYQQKNQEGFTELEGIIYLLNNMTNRVSELELEGNHVNIDIVKVNQILTDAMNALENLDTILLSDILNYELKEVLIEYQDSIL